MVELRQVDQSNFYDCIGLKRESSRYVGNAEHVLAEAYLFREFASAYAIYAGGAVAGLVIIADRPAESQGHYSFTNLFIGDDFQRRNYGNEAVEAIIEKCRAEKKRDAIEIQVHRSNSTAIRIYEKHGFIKVGNAEWDENFDVMRRDLS